MGRDLVVVEPDLELGLEKELLVLRRQGKVVRRSRLQDLDQVLLMGAQELTASARSTLLKRGIDVIFMTSDGRYTGRLSNYLSRNGPLRLAQYRFCSQSEQSLALAASLVQAKIANQRQILLQRQRRLQQDALADALAEMRVLHQNLGRATAIDQLMGYEGRAAAVYFRVFPLLLSVDGFQMQGRSKRPPRDPVNAALSFGYTILTRLVETAVLKAGLDPYLGFLHQARHGLPALVLDLVEEFRPVLVDTLILRLINRGQLQPRDFYHPDAAALAEAILAESEPEAGPDAYDPRPAVYMNETGRRIFFQAWYERLRESVLYPPQGRQLEWRDLVQQQVYHLARVLTAEDPVYLPFQSR